jgi:ABC-type lipoprotein export system ATPase subunit
VADAGARKRATELIEMLGLSHRLKHPPADLSTGERQRVALARAMLNQPALVLADEPTGNLDSANAAIVIRHLREFTERGGAVLLATHDNRIDAGERYELVHGALQELSSVESPTAS